MTARRATCAVALIGLASFLGCSPSPHDLAARGDLEKLASMLDRDPELLQSLNEMEKTPLHYAVTYGKDESVQLLLDRGADVNAADITGYTPLHVAATLDRVDEARLLLEAGANIEARDSFGDTPLHAAALHGRLDMIRFLLNEGANESAENDDGATPYDLAVRERKTDAANRLAPD